MNLKETIKDPVCEKCEINKERPCPLYNAELQFACGVYRKKIKDNWKRKPIYKDIK